MKGVASKILIALGIILILAAILWWAIAVNALVKLPDDINITNYYEGEMTLYVDLLTQAPLAPGEEMKLPLRIEQDLVSESSQYDSSTGIIKETFMTSAGGVEQDPENYAYALDRKTLENQSSDLAYAWVPGNVVNREGSYYPLFTFDTSKDGNYSYWKNEINQGVEAEFLKEDEREGVTVYNFKLAFEDMEVAEGYIEYLDLPTEITMENLKPSLAAQGVDVDAFVALAAQVMSAEDLQALNQALQAAIPVTYLWSMDWELAVEPKTGIPVDLYQSQESLSMKMDLEGLAQVFMVLQAYTDDPTLGPIVTQLTGIQSAMGDSLKIFDRSYTSTEDSIKEAADEAKGNAGTINLVKVYIPWALLIVGALILIIGLLIGGGQAPPQQAEE